MPRWRPVGRDNVSFGAVLEQRRKELAAQDWYEPANSTSTSIRLDVADGEGGQPSLDGAARRYAEFGATTALLDLETPADLEALVRRELGLSDTLDRATLEQLRRRFARRHHPDLVDPAVRSLAQACMTIANTLIDEALSRARAR